MVTADRCGCSRGRELCAAGREFEGDGADAGLRVTVWALQLPASGLSLGGLVDVAWRVDSGRALPCTHWRH